MSRRAAYRELPEAAPGYRHAWNVDGDARRGARVASAEAIAAAARLVRRGAVFGLDLPVGRFPAGFLGRAPVQYVEELTPYGRDDRLDGFYLQSGSQWDGLRHVRHRGRYFGGATDDDLARSDALGIAGAAERGIVGRAVLVDIDAHWRALGRTWSPASRTVVGVDDLAAALARQRTALRDGDVLLVRTGWLGWILGEGAGYAATHTVESAECVGLDPGERTAEWIWDSGAIAVACDTPALEALPIRAREEGFLHHRLLPLLGILVGELWDLDALAADCAADGVYEGLLVSTPLRVARGAGSPANACVLR